MGRRLAAAAVARELIGAHVVAVAIGVALSLLAPRALAQTDELARAAAAFQRGLALYQAQDFVGASDEFRTSYRLDPRPEALFAWAQAARLSDDCTTAIELYTEFLDGEPRSEDAAAARSAREVCAERIARAVADGADDEPSTAALDDDEPTEVAADEDWAAAGDDAEPEAAIDEHELAAHDRASIRSRAPTASPAVRRAARRPAKPSHRLLAFARVDIDASGRGAVVAPGIDLAMSTGWELFASALVGGNRGAEVGARYAGTSGRLRPFVTAALPVFMIEGYHPGLRAAVGVRAPFGSDLGLSLELGGARALSAPAGAARTVALVSLGLELTL